LYTEKKRRQGFVSLASIQQTPGAEDYNNPGGLFLEVWYNNSSKLFKGVKTLPEQKPKFVHLATWGCQMNDHDSEVMRALLEQSGLVWTEEVEEADVVVLNTCSVRKSAEQKAMGFLGALKHLKESRPGVVVAVGGCMTQNREIRDQLRKSAHVNIIFGARSFHRLPSLISRYNTTRAQVVETDMDEQPPSGALPAHRDSPIKAYVTIMYGCNNFCSYCVVPYARGREKSRPLTEICEEVGGLADGGYLEVMLLGQNVNSYGKDLPGGVNFAALLEELDLMPGLARIHYMTSHPRDFSDELITTIRQSRKVCEHFHLPLQSGSNSVLERMNRGYTREQYLQLVAKIRSAIPAASITTDLILGFPGETEQEFQETLDLVERVRFDAIYVFLYSPRPGTAAAAMLDQISGEVKKQRFTRLTEAQNEISLEINKALVGQDWEVLVEGKSKTNPERWSGRTRTGKIVVFKGEGDLTGKIVEVAIDCAQTWNLIATLKNIRIKEESLPLRRT
jgi:tRNA-2-methylthio-N6-dimethylallyladenosine synthase